MTEDERAEHIALFRQSLRVIYDTHFIRAGRPKEGERMQLQWDFLTAAISVLHDVGPRGWTDLFLKTLAEGANAPNKKPAG